MALQFSNNNNNNVIQGKGRSANSFIKSFMQQSGNQNSSESTSSFKKFSTFGMNSGDNTSSSGGNTQNPPESKGQFAFDKPLTNGSPSNGGSYGNYDDYQSSQLGPRQSRTMDIQDSDGDRIDDRDQGGPGQPKFRDNPDFYSGGGGNDAPTESLGGDTEAPTDKFAKAREAADKYKSYMDDGSGTGWGSSEFKGSHNYIGPNELNAMRRDSGLSDTELNDFFQTGEGQQYLHRRHRTGGTGSKFFNNMTSELAKSAQSAQEYKDNYVDSKFSAPTDIDKTDNSSVNSNNTTNDNSMNDSNNREDYDKQNDNQGVIGDGTQANNNSGLVGDGTKMDDNTGNIGDDNAQDSYNTDINSTTGESGQGGIDNTNIKSPFEVSGDLTNDIGNQSQNDYNFSNSTVGDFAKIGNDYSVTIGNIGNGNNTGSDSGQGSNAPMNNMQSAAAYGALNTNAQQKSSDQLSGLERGVIGAGLASSLTNSTEFAANAYNNAAAAAQNFRDRAAVGEDKLYGNTDFDLSGWSPLRSPKKPEDKTQEIADSFN